MESCNPASIIVIDPKRMTAAETEVSKCLDRIARAANYYIAHVIGYTITDRHGADITLKYRLSLYATYKGSWMTRFLRVHGVRTGLQSYCVMKTDKFAEYDTRLVVYLYDRSIIDIAKLELGKLQQFNCIVIDIDIDDSYPLYSDTGPY